MKKLLKVLGIALAVLILIVLIGLVYFNMKYPDVEPAKNIKVAVTNDKIERGKYLANHVTICIDCHSTRDWTKFSGPIIQGTEGKGGFDFGHSLGLPGEVYAKNITPAEINKWTDGELIRAITQGVNKDNVALFPLMPYYNFNSLTQEDLEAIITYIRSLKPIENKVPQTELDFPVNFIVKTIPLKTYTPSKPVNRSDSIQYGKYLVTIAHCDGCHTPTEKGTPIPGMEFAGGEKFPTPWGLIKSVNITPDIETGIGNWSKERFINTFKDYSTEEARNIHVEPNSYNSVMPWTLFGGMTEEDLGAIYSYLRTVKPVKHFVIRYTPLASKK